MPKAAPHGAEDDGLSAGGEPAAQMAGLGGPVCVSERLMQRIWARGQFRRSGWRTELGAAILCLHPGRWNRLGGPDFLDARFDWEGRPVCGEVELHLRAGDWAAHGHERDPAYAATLLHVVLFPPRPGEGAARTRTGRRVDSFVLLPHLLWDMEDYLGDAALEDLLPAAGRAAAAEICEAADWEGLARARWAGKLEQARRRLSALGWREACHVGALEVLGARANRAPMVWVAERFPFSTWSKYGPEGPPLAELLGAAQGLWRRQGLRPAAYPERRLQQYRQWVHLRPSWPEALADWCPPSPPAGPLPEPEPGVEGWKRHRADWGLRRWEESLAEAVHGGALSPGKARTAEVDLFLPLLAAAGKLPGLPWERVWLAWGAGDAPERPGFSGRGCGLNGWVQARLEWERRSACAAVPGWAGL